MSYTRPTIVVAFIAAVAFSGLPEGIVSDGTATTSRERRAVFTTSIVYETQEQLDTARNALAQMADAGLKLPAVTIHMHSDRADCSIGLDRLRSGYYTQVDGENIVYSCGTSLTLLHELAHVWDKSRLDDATRQLLLEHQGLVSWRHETWSQAGAEHLAEIVAGALGGTYSPRIGIYSRSHLADGYRLATGNDPPDIEPEHTMDGVPADQTDIIDWALGLFDTAGLELPGIDFISFADTTDCFDRTGASIRRGYRTEVRLCLNGTPQVDDWVVLHQIAHAWDNHNLIESQRDTFLTMRDLESWRLGERHKMGSENAAETLVWGLLDRPLPPGRFGEISCDELLAGYRFLTGAEPMPVNADLCS